MSAYSTSSFAQLRSRLLTGCAIAAAAVGSQAQAQQAFQATPTNTVNASVNQATGRDTVTITGPQALIDWTPTDNAVGGGAIEILAAGDELRFQADNLSLPRYTVLNRINPADTGRAVRIDGLVNSLVDTGYGVSDGSIWFYTPGGIILGSNAQFDVGSLVLTTNAIQIGNLDDTGLFAGEDTSAFAGRIEFRGAADSKSFITIEAGAKINAASSYVALVSPRIAQRGAITVNGSAALIAAESADVTIPVSGNLFDISVFGGSKVDTAGETVLEHSGSTQITNPSQSENTRSVYMVAVPKNDAITMLVSGTVGYEAASQVSAESGDVILLAGSNATINFNNPNADAGPDATITASGLSVNTRTTVLATEFALDATAASSNFRRDLFSFSDRNTVEAANGFGISVGQDNGGDARFGNKRTSISLSSGSTMSVAGNLIVQSQVGSFPQARVTAPPVSLTVDDATLTVGGTLSLRSRAIGENGTIGEDAFGGNVVAIVRNEGLLDVAGSLDILSEGFGGESGYGPADIGGIGGGGLASLAAESGGQIFASSLTLSSFGTGGEGTTGGAGQGGVASFTVAGGSVETGYGILVQSIGQGGSSATSGGQSGSGAGGTSQLIVTDSGTVTASSGLNVLARGQAGSELGYGSITGGAAVGGIVEVSAAAGGIITASSLTVDVSGAAGFGQLGGGSGTGGSIDIDVTGGSKLTASTVNLSLQGTGGGTGSSSGEPGGSGIGGFLTFDTSASTLTFNQLTVDAQGQGNSSFSGDGGTGIGGVATINFVSTKMTGSNVINVDAMGGGGESGSTIGGSGSGGQIVLTFDSTDLTTSGDISLNAKGAGDFGDNGGGAGTGGKIDFSASKSTVLASNIVIDASGFGEQAFSIGSAGLGQGGTINVASTAGGMVKGLNTVTAEGRGGSAGGSADTGAGLGGTIGIQAAGGSIDSTGATLTVVADGQGGRTQFSDAADPLSRGGTIEIGVSGAGELKLTALDAHADGYFDDQPDGPVLNNGSTGVGGTVRIAMSGGSLSGDNIALSASGRGAVSTNGGKGGAAFQGRAELSLTGGTAAFNTLSVEALAIGGQGFDQSGEGGIDAGSGGSAGVGASPFSGVAGAIVDVSGGSLSAIDATIDGGSTGGVGGEGDRFAGAALPGNGGEAIGGVALFTTSGTGAVSVGSLTVRAVGTGGDGGSVLLFDSGSSDAVGGIGGAGTGGLVFVTLGGSGGTSLGNVFADASGQGGQGGSVEDSFGSQLFGAGAGGQGGAAFGGRVEITANTQVDGFTYFMADSSASGGQGGLGPRGGSGGDAQGGSGTIAVATGNVFYNWFEVYSDGAGGRGGDGLSNDGGQGAIGRAGSAAVTIGAGADLTVDRIQLYARGFGGDGGAGGGGPDGFNGGAGGFAAGGDVKITVNGGRAQVAGGSEAPPVSITVNATGGQGGSGGGTTSEGSGGIGGDGGNAQGGTATFASVNGDIDFFYTTLNADGFGGARGTPGSGFGTSIPGNPGFGSGGTVKINVDQTGVPANSVRLGLTEIAANGGANGEEGALSAAGYIAFDVKGSNSAGALAFDSLDAGAMGFTLPEDQPSGIKIVGAGAPITVDGDANIRASGPIDFILSGNSGLRAIGDVSIDSASLITIAHAGQAPGGSFASLSGADVVLNTTGGIDAAATSRIDATGGLSLNAFGGDVNIGSGRVNGSIVVDATGDLTLGAGAELIADRSITFRSGDDIIIGTGALLRAANDPPAETGYGVSDPLQQQTQLRLYAGALFQGEGRTTGDIWSLIINGDVQSAGRTMQLEAEAIQAADGTTLSGGNLYVRKLGTTPPTPFDDFGQLSAPCLQGSVCLGNVAFTGRVEIGGSGFAPTNLRISGDLSGTSVFAGATDTIRLGRDGFTSTITVANVLTVDARDGDLLGFGTISLTGGTGLTSLYAGGNLSARGMNITAPNGLDLVSGGDVVLGKIDASLILTRDQDLSIVNPGGITAQGLIDLVSVTTAGDLLLDSAVGITVGTATIASGKTLTVDSGGAITLGDASAGTIALTAVGQVDAKSLAALSGDATVQSDTASISLASVSATGQVELQAAQGNIAVTTDLQSAGGVTALARSISLTSASGLNIVSAKATAGDLLLATTAGDIQAGTSSATGATTLASAGNIGFSSLTTGAGLSATGAGAISGGDVFASGTFANLTGSNGVSIDTLVAESSQLFAPGGAVKVASVSSVPGGITASGESVSLIGSGGLKVTLAEATAGDVVLSSSFGAIAADTVAATGDITATGKSVTIAVLKAGDEALLIASGGDVIVSNDAASGGGITASGTSVSLAALGDLNIDQATATGGNVDLTSQADINFTNLSASEALSLIAAGQVAGGAAAAGQSASIAADGGISLASLSANGPATLSSKSGAIQVTGLSASDLIATGASIDIGGPTDLFVSLAEATAGDVTLTTAGDLIAADIRASGAATLTAGGLLSVADLAAARTAASGAVVNLASAGDLTISKAAATSGDLTLNAQGIVRADFAEATNGVVDVTGANGISLADVRSNATVKLASSNGAVVATGSTPAIAFQAVGKSVALTGAGALSAAVQATGGDASLTSLGGGLTVNGSATDNFTLTSAAGVTFSDLRAGGALSMAAQGDVQGGSATAASILVSTPGAVTADDLVATAGTLAVLAGKGITLDTAVSTGTTTLKTDQGVITVLSDVRPGQGLIVQAPSINLTAQNGLNIAQAVATAGDLKLTTVAGDLIAGNSSATGAIALNSAGALSFVTLAAQQGVTLNAAGTIVGDAITSKAGAVSVSGTKGVTLGSIAAAGPVTLGASAGTILVANDLATSGPIQAAAQAISLTAINDMIVTQAQATGGDIVLRSTNGNLTLGQASATNGLTATAANLLSVTGSATAATIAFTSKDIALGSGAQVGSVAQTSSLTLTSTADRTFLGGSGTGGYRLDGAEIGKIAAQNITVSAQPQGQVGTAFAFVEPASASVVMESLNFTGAQLGSAGTFTINSSRAIGVTGDVLFKGFSSGQRVLYQAGQEISLSAETGLVRVVDNSGGLAGVLELRAPQVTAMSVPARAQIPNLSLNDAEQRLGTNDQVENDGGYFQAGKIIVRIDRLVFIQNSGGPGDLDARRGFSANEMEIVSTGSNPAQVVINGRVGTAVGSDLAGAITLTGDFDTASTFSGCAFGSTICGGPSPSFALGAVSSARDQIEDEEDEDEKEEALQASQTRPDPIIQFLTAPSSRFDPLIDEPVTGAGNEDFWEIPLVPSPGR